jgi:hypothetical protein
MREDIAKKLLEPPRYGGGGKHQLRSDRRAGKDSRKWESLPQKESMRAPNIRGWNGKYYNATSAPLRGFLKKNVGRPWNKVYSELCAALRPTAAVRRHVFDHLVPNYVTLKPIFRKGSKVPYNQWGGEVRGFYVDPHGLLKNNDSDKAKKRRSRDRRRRYREDVRKTLNDFEEYRKINGSWFHVTYKHLRAGESGYDVILRKEIMIGRWGCHELSNSNGQATRMGSPVGWDRYRVAVAKRQVSKKEVKREGLNKL